MNRKPKVKLVRKTYWKARRSFTSSVFRRLTSLALSSDATPILIVEERSDKSEDHQKYGQGSESDQEQNSYHGQSGHIMLAN